MIPQRFRKREWGAGFRLLPTWRVISLGIPAKDLLQNYVPFVDGTGERSPE
jgi:hypothetical protein